VARRTLDQRYDPKIAVLAIGASDRKKTMYNTDDVIPDFSSRG